MHQLKLLTQRRFWPMFWTQFLGAFNDNFFKNALVILIAYKAVQVGGFDAQQMVALAGGLFILPFFLFSAVAGQMADRFSKSAFIPWIKTAEIAVMSLAAVGFLAESITLLLVVLFLMGLQSALFGPVKFGILPQLLGKDELVAGNALVEMGTFLAILLGTIGGGLLIATDNGGLYVSLAVVAFAIFGTLTSLFLIKLPAEAPDLKIQWNPVTPAWRIFKHTRANYSIFQSILGISWFWFLGASVLAVFPTWCSEVLNADETVVTLLLALFSVGIGIGSMLCERLSRGHLELGLVPLGSIGMTIFLVDLFIAGRPDSALGEMQSAGMFLAHSGNWRILVDLFALAVFGGFYIVPLNTLVQQRAEPAHRSRVVAGGNIISAFFMVLSAGALIGAGAIGMTIPQIFLVLALLNCAVALYIYLLIPEFLYRFLCWMLANVMYRLRVVGEENIPEEGPAVLVCNHVTFIDWMIIAAACKRPVRLVMHYSFGKYPVMNWLCRQAHVIPIASAKENPEVLKAAYDQIALELEAGNVVCIFPEGGLTKDGNLQPFRSGIEKIIARTPAPVVPLALCGLWGSYFSRKDNKALRRPFRRVWSRLELRIGAAVPAEEAKAPLLQDQVLELRGAEL
jgi:1-acyl-sn-glycerol-3-phosphate acyltransferase